MKLIFHVPDTHVGKIGRSKYLYLGYSGNEITKELLDSVKVGNFVRCNNWKQGMKVKGVSKYYFLMARNMFGKTLYSVCEKYPTALGNFYIGTDNLIFGHHSGYKFDDENVVKEYLDDFETGKITLSRRTETKLNVIFIKQ